MEKIERHEIQVVLPAGDRLSQLAEVGQASLIQDDDLAVDDCALDAKITTGLGQVEIGRCPVEPAPGAPSDDCWVFGGRPGSLAEEAKYAPGLAGTWTSKPAWHL